MIFGLSQSSAVVIVAVVTLIGGTTTAVLTRRASREATEAKVEVAKVTVAQEGNESAIHGLTSLADEQRADMLDLKADMRTVKAELRECHDDKRRLSERITELERA